jgi:hypothetical protein
MSLGDFAKFSKIDLSPCKDLKMRDQTFQVLRIVYDKEGGELQFERKQVHLATDQSIEWVEEGDPA